MGQRLLDAEFDRIVNFLCFVAPGEGAGVVVFGSLSTSRDESPSAYSRATAKQPGLAADPEFLLEDIMSRLLTLSPRNRRGTPLTTTLYEDARLLEGALCRRPRGVGSGWLFLRT